MIYWVLDPPSYQRGERGVLSVDIVDLFDIMGGGHYFVSSKGDAVELRRVD